MRRTKKTGKYKIYIDQSVVIIIVQLYFKVTFENIEKVDILYLFILVIIVNTFLNSLLSGAHNNGVIVYRTLI